MFYFMVIHSPRRVFYNKLVGKMVLVKNDYFCGTFFYIKNTMNVGLTRSSYTLLSPFDRIL